MRQTALPPDQRHLAWLVVACASSHVNVCHSVGARAIDGSRRAADPEGDVWIEQPCVGALGYLPHAGGARRSEGPCGARWNLYGARASRPSPTDHAYLYLGVPRAWVPAGRPDRPVEGRSTSEGRPARVLHNSIAIPPSARTSPPRILRSSRRSTHTSRLPGRTVQRGR